MPPIKMLHNTFSTKQFYSHFDTLIHIENSIMIKCIISLSISYIANCSQWKSFPAIYSLILHAAKVFHLKRFAIYGILLHPYV